MRGVASSAPLTSTSIEAAVTRLRDLVFEGADYAPRRADELRRRIDVVGMRADLLAAMAALNSDDQGGRDGTAAAAQRLSQVLTDDPQVLTSDPDVQLELAVALLVTDQDADATSRALASLGAYEQARLDPATAAGAVRYLIGHHRAQAAEQLLLTLLPAAFAPPTWQDAEPGGTVVRAEPSAFARQLLTATLAASEQVRDRSPDDLAMRRLRVSALVGLGQLGGALAEITEILRRDPADTVTQWAEVVTLARLGQPGAALAQLDEMPRDAVSAAEVVTVRVRLLLSAGRADEAAGVARDAADRYPDNIAVQLALAEVLTAAGESKQSLDLVDELLTKHPAEPALLTLRGVLLHRGGELPDAKQSLSEAVAGDPASADARIALASVLADSGNPEGALAQLEQVPAQDPRRGEALLERARVLRSSRQPVAALEVLGSAEEAGVDGPALHEMRGQLLLELGRETEAASWFERGLTAAINSGADAQKFVDALDLTARRLTDQGRYEVALATLTSLVSAHRISSSQMALRAELLRLTSRWHECLAQADQAVAAGADASWVSSTQAAALVSLSRSQEALVLLGQPLRADPNYQFASSYQVSALDRVGRPADALTIVKRLARQKRDEEWWRTWLVTVRAELLNNLGRFGSAVRFLRNALKERQEFEWYGPLAVAYSRQSRHEDAVATWRLAVAMPGEEPQDWGWVEFADALSAGGSAAGSSASDEATAIYRRLASKTAADALPTDVIMWAWAALRLGELDGAITHYRWAIDAATDHLAGERLRLAMALFLAGNTAEGERELGRALADLAGLADRACAETIIGETHYAIGVLKRDPGRGDAEILERLRERLPPAAVAQARVTEQADSGSES
jgi:tetratricopeptide (TPR) repeat protein